MQGFNMGRYRPPDADPRTQPFNTTHPLSKRLRHSTLTVRFELPFPIICLGCNTHLAQGVRFNAAKAQVGEYLTTKIWSFTCKCPNCAAKFDIRTDPQHAQYVVGEGARRKVEEWDPAQNGGFAVYDPDKPTDAFASVEQAQKQSAKAQERQKRIEELESAQQAWSDPYTVNANLRRSFRRDKRASVEAAAKDAALRARIGWRDDHVLQPTSPGTAEHDAAAWRAAQAGQAGSSRRTRTSSAPGDKPIAGSTAAHRLGATLVANIRQRRDPFLQQMHAQSASSSQRLLRPSAEAAEPGSSKRKRS